MKSVNKAYIVGKQVASLINGDAVHRYIVQCWIRPKSGFDLAKKNRILTLFDKFLSAMGNFELQEAFKDFSKETEGLILEPIVVETDKEVKDCEKELMPEIRKTYPEALPFAWEKIPIFIA